MPSGASTGTREALELRDGGTAFGGKGVTHAVENVNGEIAAAVTGRDAGDQRGLDERMIALDGTDGKSRLGANAILGVSMAAARAAAATRTSRCGATWAARRQACCRCRRMNVLNGGVHADNPVDFQEFMIAPVGAGSFAQAMQMGTEVYHELQRTLKSRGLGTAVGDEGGFAPALESNEAPLELLVGAIRPPATDLAMTWRSASIPRRASSSRTAATSWPAKAARCPRRRWSSTGRRFLIAIPVLLARGRHGGGGLGGLASSPTARSRLQLVGDDIFVTNPAILREGIDRGVANSILIKLNQIGTLTETLDTIALAHERRLSGGHLASLRRDRGHVHRRPGRGDRGGTDQDRRAGSHRARREVQPAAADRGGARGARTIRRTRGRRPRLSPKSRAGRPAQPASLSFALGDEARPGPRLLALMASTVGRLRLADAGNPRR